MMRFTGSYYPSSLRDTIQNLQNVCGMDELMISCEIDHPDQKICLLESKNECLKGIIGYLAGHIQSTNDYIARIKAGKTGSTGSLSAKPDDAL